MSLEFVIIPITSVFITTAEDIHDKLKNAIQTNINIQFDTNYDTIITQRINKWKKTDFNIITIDDNYDQTNTITVRFSDKRTKPEIMEVEEFIDLVASFEDEEQHTIDSDDDDKQNGGCIVM